MCAVLFAGNSRSFSYTGPCFPLSSRGWKPDNYSSQNPRQTMKGISMRSGRWKRNKTLSIVLLAAVGRYVGFSR